jgi:hypothetical protein
MWPLFLITGTIALGAWLYGASKVGQPIPGTVDTFTAKGVVQVGDVVEVAMVSLDDAFMPTELMPPNDMAYQIADQTRQNRISQADAILITSMGPSAQAGGTTSLTVTAVGQKNKDGLALCIGTLDMIKSVQVPMCFLPASVRKITRNGKVLA